MAEASDKSQGESQLVDLSSELESDASSPPASDGTDSEETRATASDGTGEASDTASTEGSADASAAPGDSATTDAGASDPMDAAIDEAIDEAIEAEPAAAADASSDAEAADAEETDEPAGSPSAEDHEWLFEPPTPPDAMQGPSSKPGAASFKGTVLDARKTPLAAAWTARSFVGTVLDSRSTREVKGRTVEKWTQQKTTLDSRAAHEVKGRIISANQQRFAGTILDSRAARTNTQSPLAAKNLVRRFSAQSLLNPTPPTTGRFFVLLGPVPDFAFHECSGLSFSLETEPYAEGGAGWNQHFPSRLEYERLVFKRGLVIGPGWIQLRRWRESMLDDGPPLRMNGVIVMQNDLGVPICFWRFKNGYPVRWSGPTLTPGSTELAVEELEIAHEGLKVIDIALAADVVSSSAVGMGSVMASDAGSSAMNSGMGIAQGAMSGDGSALGALLGG